MVPEDDDVASAADRARLATLPVISFPVDVAVLLDTPASTLEKLAAQGRGPRTFRIGRRRKTTPQFVGEWTATLAEAEAP